MKLVNEQLKNLKIMIGKEIETVGADGSIEVSDDQTEVIESLIASGFVCTEKKAPAPKAKKPETKAAPKVEAKVEEVKEEEETEKVYKTVSKEKEKPANRFQRS